MKIIEVQENFNNETLVNIIKKCLERNPKKRFQKNELYDEISACTNEDDPDSRHDSKGRPLEGSVPTGDPEAPETGDVQLEVILAS